MQLLFNVPPKADGVLLRGFLRRCAVSTELARAVKFHGSGFFADDAPILANRRVQAGQTIRFALPADGPGVEPQPGQRLCRLGGCPRRKPGVPLGEPDR